MNDTNSLAHPTWNCKYHIVFAPKYRRKVFFGQKRKEIGAILRSLCEWKQVEIIEAALEEKEGIDRINIAGGISVVHCAMKINELIDAVNELKRGN